MSAIQMLAFQPWVERLGWTLVHFLWQGFAIAMLYAAVRVRMRASSANRRYLLACGTLAAMTAAPVITWVATGPGALPDPVYRISAAPPGRAAAEVAVFLPDAVRATVSPATLLPWVVVVWFAGAAFFWIRLAGGWMMAARMRSSGVSAAPADWAQTFSMLAARLGVMRSVRLLTSAMVEAPTVTGWLRPVVLVPLGAFSGMHSDHLEALLLHELAHIRRHDFLVNILQSIAEALLFYHPAVWWVSGHIRSEREACCDDVAVNATGDVLTYARALATLAAGQMTAAPVLSAAGGSLAHRIARLLGQSRKSPRGGMGPGVVTVAVLLAGAAYGLLAQNGPRPEFETASIKRNSNPTQRGMGLTPHPGGRLTSNNAPVLMMIQNAYQVQAFQVIGGPSWINTDGYDIEAKPASPVDRPQMRLMLQSLLADRFKLALHRETRELPVYTLQTARGGFKAPPPADGGCNPNAVNGPPPPGTPPPCGRILIAITPQGITFNGGKTQMAELVRILAMVTARPVLDRTGIAAEFDVKVDFTPDGNTMGLPGQGGPRDPGGPSVPTDDKLPNLTSALQEQLGLRLVSTKAPVEVLVIDRVERPSAN